METLSQHELMVAVETALETLNVPVVSDSSSVTGFPYLLLYTIPGGAFTGPPLHNPEADAHQVIQVTSVGKRTDQARILADDVRDVVIGRQDDGQFKTAIPGVVHRYAYGGPPGIEPEGEAGERIYSIPERFVLVTTTS